MQTAVLYETNSNMANKGDFSVDILNTPPWKFQPWQNILLEELSEVTKHLSILFLGIQEACKRD